MLFLFRWINSLIYKFMEWRGPRKTNANETAEVLKKMAEVDKLANEGK